MSLQEGWPAAYEPEAATRMRDDLERVSEPFQFHSSDDDLSAKFLARRAYRAGQRSVINTVRLTAESVGPALTMANALQHALRTYRAYKAERDDPELRADLRAKAMRQVELYEMHRAALVRIERTRRALEAMDRFTAYHREMGLWP